MRANSCCSACFFFPKSFLTFLTILGGCSRFGGAFFFFLDCFIFLLDPDRWRGYFMPMGGDGQGEVNKKGYGNLYPLGA